MQIFNFNPEPTINHTNFKSAIPVFVYTIPKGKTMAEASPIISDKMIAGYMNQLTRYLNNTLKKGQDTQRDTFITALRNYFHKTIGDFNGKVKAFTCVDGGLRGYTLKPLFYYTTGYTKSCIEALGAEYTNAKKYDQDNQTTELERMNQIYPLHGKTIINAGYAQLKQNCGVPVAFHVYFMDEYTKTGKLKSHTIVNYEFKPNNTTNPTITLI